MSLLILYKTYSWRKQEAKRQKIESKYLELRKKLKIKVTPENPDQGSSTTSNETKQVETLPANTTIDDILEKYKVDKIIGAENKSKEITIDDKLKKNYDTLLDLWLAYGEQGTDGVPVLKIKTLS
jgi:hypothetical protein